MSLYLLQIIDGTSDGLYIFCSSSSEELISRLFLLAARFHLHGLARIQ